MRTVVLFLLAHLWLVPAAHGQSRPVDIMRKDCARQDMSDEANRVEPGGDPALPEILALTPGRYVVDSGVAIRVSEEGGYVVEFPGGGGVGGCGLASLSNILRNNRITVRGLRRALD